MGEKWINDPGKGKDMEGFALRIALCFPDSYRVGMANLGFLWVYTLLNRYTEVRCDRFFVDDRQLNKRGGAVSLETGRTLGEYDVVAFSLPYEGGYPAVPAALVSAGLEPFAAKRKHGPVVIAGGMAAGANPEPIADFLDAVLVGEAESALDGFIGGFLAAAGDGRSGKLFQSAALSAIRGLPGCYLPGDYAHSYGADGNPDGIDILNGAPGKVHSVHLEKITEAAHSPVVTDASAFPGMFLVEASRGCPYNCRFCMAGHTTNRYRTSGGVKEAVAKGLTCASRVGFIGTAFTRSTEIREACAMVLDSGGRVSFSSMRMDRRTLDLLGEIGDSLDIDSIAVAPEVATKGLAAVIGKDISGDLETFISSMPMPALRKLRLYYLVGVPGETDGDLEAIADQAGEINRRTGWEVLISATPMIPKPFTPMQWAPLAEEGELKRKKRILKKAARSKPGVTLKVESITETVKQAVLSRGDRELGKTLMAAVKKGRPADWMEFLPAGAVEKYAMRSRKENERFPWETLDRGIPREKLYEEYTAAMKAAKSNEGNNGQKNC